MNRSLFTALGLLTAGCLLAGPTVAQQKVYQWKDASGRTHYTSSPPASGKYTERGMVAPAPVAAKASQVETRLRDLNPDDLTARQALDLLYELRGLLPS